MLVLSVIFFGAVEPAPGHGDVSAKRDALQVLSGRQHDQVVDPNNRKIIQVIKN